MLNFSRIHKSDRQMKALTGMTSKEFDLLVPEFEKNLYERSKREERKRDVGGGRKGRLESAEKKLFFILVYLKTYPTYDVAAAIFDVDKSRISRWISRFLPILETVLGRSCVLPTRQIKSVEEFFKYFENEKNIFLDGTERPTQNSKNDKKQRKNYSGKKKRHTRKNIIGTDENKRIRYISPTKGGKTHDFKQTQKGGILPHIPDDVTTWIDKGFQGITNTLAKKNVQIPHKKPKGGELTHEQKIENKAMAGIRIVVEHAISGIKRFNCLTHIFRGRKGQDDRMITVCAGLWNFHLQCAR